MPSKLIAWLGRLKRPLQGTSLYTPLERLAYDALDLRRAASRVLHAAAARARSLAPAAAGPPLDLRDRVTVFVTTVGAPTFDAVLAALAAQDCLFTGPVVIRDVFPMDRAFRRMIDLCTTQYYVQVDEDMVLRPHAVRHLVEALDRAPPEDAIVCRPLWDTQLERAIVGVKACRREVLARFPYGGRDMDQYARMAQAGHRVQTRFPTDAQGAPVEDDPHREEVLGEHRVDTKEAAYGRFKDNFAKFGHHTAVDHVAQDLAAVLARLGLDRRPDDPDVWALLGAVAGAANPERRSKDARAFRLSPELRPLRAFVLGGPEDLGLWLEGASALPSLRRLLALHRAARTLHLLGPDPLGSPDLAGVLRAAEGAGLDVVVHTTRPAAACTLLGRRVRVAVSVDVSAAGAADDVRAAVSLARGGLPVALTLHADAASLEQADALVRDLDRRDAPLTLEVRGPLPAAGAGAAPGADALAALAARVEGLRAPVAVDGRSTCDSPFRAVVADAAGSISGCARGVVPPAAAQGSIWEGRPDLQWYQPHLVDLRDALLGKRPLEPACAACPWRVG